MSSDCERTRRENVTLGSDTLSILNIIWRSVGQHLTDQLRE